MSRGVPVARAAAEAPARARTPCRALGALAAALLTACGPSTPRERATGALVVSVVAASGGPALTRVHLAASPAGVDADLVLDPETSRWSGSFTVPAGVPQTLTATAWAGEDPVGSGTAEASVPQHGTALVAIAILDATTRPPGADHGPIVTSLTASAAPVYGTPLTLLVAAADPDGDALAYAWSASCAGSFSAPDAPSTAWTPAATGACTVTAEARSRGVAHSGSLALNVAAPAPQLSIVEDSDYPFANDPRSTYPYRIDSPDYATLNTTATTVFGTSDKHVRLVRYVVSNPGPLPVAIDPVNLANAWRMSEIWEQQGPAVSGGESALGTTCPSLGEDGMGYVLTPVCGVGEAYPGELGPASVDGACESTLDNGATLVPMSGLVIGRAVTLDASGVEGGPAPKLGPRTIVPAASGGAPGRIALYLSRPLQNRSPPASWSGSAWTFDQRVWLKTSAPAEPTECPEGWPGEWDAVWDLYLRPQSLFRARDWLFGSFTLTAYALDSAGTALAGPATPQGTVDFSRLIEH